MKKRITTLFILGTLLLSMSLTVFNVPVLAAPAPSVWLETTTTTFGPTPNPIGTVFEVKIMVNFTGYSLNTIDVNMKWNPSVFQMKTSPLIFTKGTFMPGTTMFMDPAVDNSTGTADGLSGAIPSSGTVTGSGWLGSFNFVIVGFNSSTVIDLSAVSALDPGMTYIIGPNADMPGDLTMSVLTPPPLSPTAYFTFSPVFPFINETVTFDASGSSDGFDGTSTCPITLYTWDFDDGNVTDSSADTITHKFATSGSFNVNLTVYAPGVPAPPGPYDSYDDDVPVRPPVTGRSIDLYTSDYRHTGKVITPFIGEGSGTEADAYAPQDLVCLFANLSYNEDPIRNKMVMFEIHGPSNPYENITIWETATTNDDGTANLCFRISWPVAGNESIVMGMWSVYAAADVAEQVVFDTLYFMVGWIVEIDWVKTCDSVGGLKTSFNKYVDDIYFKLNVTNIAKTSRDVTFTINVYDELGVVIGKAVLLWTVGPGTTGLGVLDMAIPRWTYVGSAEAHANAFTDYPWAGGVPYCPPASPAYFQITK